jgi:magnesium chelatase subunit D
LARIHAQLAGAAQVSKEDVDGAAAIIGLSLKSKETEKTTSEPAKLDLEADEAQSQPARPEFQPTDLPGHKTVPPLSPREPVFESDTTKTLPSTPLPMGKAINPYPEDLAQPEREAGSLRLPTRRFKSAAVGRGAIIGVEPATIPQDLALVSTLLESAKYQKLRWKALLEKKEPPEWVRQLLLKQGKNGHDPLILQSSDLRRYRRAAVPEQMLTLVLDYTCLKECSWQETLLPYLQWAYVERASVCLVQVGAGSSQDKLWAEKWEADNILVPRIQNRLECDRGRATPLAHGLDLALQTLRHALQHGRSAIQKAVLVVMSDGRGNIPLKVSQGIEDLPPLVGKRGIEDAFQVAQQIAALNGVESVVLNPQPKHYSDLPVKLAQVLGAKIAKIPPLKNWEVDW